MINLLAPRDIRQWRVWRTDYTYVQLKYEFINQDTGLPVALSRTFMTFYDFDTGTHHFPSRALVKSCPLLLLRAWAVSTIERTTIFATIERAFICCASLSHLVPMSRLSSATPRPRRRADV